MPARARATVAVALRPRPAVSSTPWTTSMGVVCKDLTAFAASSRLQRAPSRRLLA